MAAPAACLRDPEEILTCPFDPVHQVAAKRFPYHLIKCSTNYGAPYYMCPFNGRHVFIVEELFEIHKRKCPDRFCVEREYMHETGAIAAKCTGDLSMPQTTTVAISDDAENWEEEVVQVPDVEEEFVERQRKEVDVSKLSATQKKNYMRGIKREEKNSTVAVCGIGRGQRINRKDVSLQMDIVKASLTTKVTGIGRGCILQRQQYAISVGKDEDDEEREIKKKIHKNQKLLNEISALEAKRDRKEALEKNQLEKIDRKEIIERELKALMEAKKKMIC
ncbi:uncharacterized protein [Oscarella lobularis]|uniref:uncharacterized protein n=1 Tax=Oscarella lobularis TaxID=121494 RepID=UPI003313E325